MIFSRKQIQYELLSEKFVRARREQSITLELAEKFTKVSKKYIQAIEAGDYHLLPGEVYAENFIECYAEFLGFDSKTIIDEYRRERRITKNSSLKKQENFFYRSLEGVSKMDFIATPKIIRRAVAGTLLMSFFVYLLFQLHQSFRPPELTLYTPEANLITRNFTTTVRGRTESEVDVWINGKMILTDQTGNFQELVELKTGVNSIEVRARKKHSRERIISRNILVEDEKEKTKDLSLERVLKISL